jgi:ElaB/YqjD/DUF883 family membrane-anchored ribosome-binding protein
MEILSRKAMANSPGTNFGASDTAKTASVAAEVKGAIGEIAEPLKDKAEQLAQQQKQAGSSHIRKFATAVDAAARELEPEMPQIANSVHDVAHRIEKTADDLRNRNMDELFEEFDRYARQHPAVVFGGALMAGLVLSRFLKSSASASAQPMANRPMGNGPMGNGEL